MIGLGGSACDFLPHACSADLRVAMVVEVLDGNRGPRLCGAVVTARQGTFSARLEEFPTFDGGLPTGGCSYSGAHERAGTFTVDVILGVRTQSVSGVRVDRDLCNHVETQHLTITLP